MGHLDIAMERPRDPARGDIEPDLLCLTQVYLESQREGSVAPPEAIRAWETFYDRYLPIICDNLRRFGLREPELSDCIQEVWKKLIVRLAGFQHDPDRCSFRSWLQVLVRNQAIDLIRRERRRGFQSLDEAAAVELVAKSGGESDPPRWLAVDDELLLALQDLSRSVSPLTYQVLALRWIENRSVAETAAATGLTPQQVWTRYHRAKKRLTRLIEQRRRRLD